MTFMTMVKHAEKLSRRTDAEHYSLYYSRKGNKKIHFFCHDGKPSYHVFDPRDDKPGEKSWPVWGKFDPEMSLADIYAKDWFLVK